MNLSGSECWIALQRLSTGELRCSPRAINFGARVVRLIYRFFDGWRSVTSGRLILIEKWPSTRRSVEAWAKLSRKDISLTCLPTNLINLAHYYIMTLTRMYSPSKIQNSFSLSGIWPGTALRSELGTLTFLSPHVTILLCLSQ